jgi:ribosomal protein S18 acetylase RimI-like enzyme
MPTVEGGLKMIVRAARLEDAPAMARVNVDTSEPGQGERVEESARNWARAIREVADGTEPRNCVYIAVNDAEEVVGFAIGGPPGQEAPEGTGEVYNLGVEESYHRRGLGRRLVQAVAGRLAQVGMPALIIGCLEVNTPARRFYEALGGQVVGRRHVHEEGPEVIYGWTDTRALVAGGDFVDRAGGPG